MEDVQRKQLKVDANSARKESTSLDASDDIMMLLSLPSTREKQSKQVGEEILELLTKPTAKERSVAEKFKSHGGAQVMEFCSHGTKVECLKAQQVANEMAAKKKLERREEKELRSANTTTAAEASSPSKKLVKIGSEDAEDGEIIAETLNNCEGESQESTDDSESSGESDKCTKLHFKRLYNRIRMNPLAIAVFSTPASTWPPANMSTTRWTPCPTSTPTNRRMSRPN